MASVLGLGRHADPLAARAAAEDFAWLRYREAATSGSPLTASRQVKLSITSNALSAAPGLIVVTLPKPLLTPGRCRTRNAINRNEDRRSGLRLAPDVQHRAGRADPVR